ncbi:MAG: hypothetical protein HRU14_10760 [Planctomycetes bacterium]|nr:hypothetical protein [Planctomycetota bacterium]
MPGRSLVVVALLALLTLTLGAQGPLQLNTVLRGQISAPSSPWVAECQAYTDAMGRDFVLLCRGDSGFSVYEITNPASPVLASSVSSTTNDLKDVTVKGNTAYLTQQGGDVLVVDLTNPYNISVVNTISVSYGHNGNAQGNLFALTGTSGSMRLYDISTPANPVFLTSYNGLGMNSTHDAEFDENGTKLYCHTFTDSTTRILDVTNPSTPVQIGQIPYGNHSGVTVHLPNGQIVHGAMREDAGGHIRFYDVTNPGSPMFLSSYQPPTSANGSIHNAVSVADRWVAIAYYNDYLRILDLQDPSNPVEVGIYDPTVTNIGSSIFNGAWSCDHVRTFANGTQRYIVTEMYSPAGCYIVDFTGAPTPQEYQTNSGFQASLNVNGVVGTQYTPAITNLGIGISGSLNLLSFNVGQQWDIGAGAAPLIPASAGALTSSDGQIVNLDLTDPTLSMWFNLLQGPSYPSTPIVTFPFSFSLATSISAQMVVVRPANSSGIALSQPVRLIGQ